MTDIQPVIDSAIRQAKSPDAQRDCDGGLFVTYQDPITQEGQSLLIYPETKDIEVGAQRMGEIANMLIPETQNL